MIRDEDISTQLIRMLHYQGRIGDQQLQEILTRFRGADSETVLTALVGEKIVDATWAEEARQSLRARSRRQVDPEKIQQIERVFGQIALARKWITLSDLEEAMLEQQRLRRLKLHFRIGEILLHFGRVNLEQVKEILAEQGRNTTGCPSCTNIARLLAGAGADEASCPICSGQLVESIFHDIVGEKSP